MSERHRFPASVYSLGAEPDARFTLANERTVLAWIRTALALGAGGVALEVLGLDLDLHPRLRLSASLILIVADTASPAFGWANWMRTERAIRMQQPRQSELAPSCAPAAASRFRGAPLPGAGILYALSASSSPWEPPGRQSSWQPRSMQGGEQGARVGTRALARLITRFTRRRSLLWRGERCRRVAVRGPG